MAFTQTPEDVQVQKELVEWIVKHGGIVDPRVVIGRAPSGLRGLFVSEELPDAAAPLLQIPNELCMSYGAAWATPIVLGAKMQGMEVSNELALLLWLLLELTVDGMEGAGSFWRPLLRSMPAEVPEEFYMQVRPCAEVLAHPMAKAVVPRLQSMDALLAKLPELWQVCYKLPDGSCRIPVPGPELIQRAQYLLQTRQFGMGIVTGLVPLVDLMNHVEGARSLHAVPGKCQYFAQGPLAAGAQLAVCYKDVGKPSHMVRDYCYCPSKEEAVIDLPLPPGLFGTWEERVPYLCTMGLLLPNQVSSPLGLVWGARGLVYLQQALQAVVCKLPIKDFQRLDQAPSEALQAELRRPPAGRWNEEHAMELLGNGRAMKTTYRLIQKLLAAGYPPECVVLPASTVPWDALLQRALRLEAELHPAFSEELWAEAVASERAKEAEEEPIPEVDTSIRNAPATKLSGGKAKAPKRAPKRK